MMWKMTRMGSTSNSNQTSFWDIIKTSCCCPCIANLDYTWLDSYDAHPTNLTWSKVAISLFLEHQSTTSAILCRNLIKYTATKLNKSQKSPPLIPVTLYCSKRTDKSSGNVQSGKRSIGWKIMKAISTQDIHK